MSDITLFQWPAFVASLAGALLIASTEAREQRAGWWVLLLAVLLWGAWARLE